MNGTLPFYECSLKGGDTRAHLAVIEFVCVFFPLTSGADAKTSLSHLLAYNSHLLKRSHLSDLVPMSFRFRYKVSIDLLLTSLTFITSE